MVVPKVFFLFFIEFQELQFQSDKLNQNHFKNACFFLVMHVHIPFHHSANIKGTSRISLNILSSIPFPSLMIGQLGQLG